MADTLYRFNVSAEVADGVFQAVDEADQSRILLWRVPVNPEMDTDAGAALAQKISDESGYEVFSDAGTIYFVATTPAQCSTLLAICRERGLVAAGDKTDTTGDSGEQPKSTTNGARNFVIGVVVVVGAIILLTALGSNKSSSRPAETPQQTSQNTTPEPQQNARQATPPADTGTNQAAMPQTPTDQTTTNTVQNTSPPPVDQSSTNAAQNTSSPPPDPNAVTWRNGVEVLGSRSAPVKIELFFSPTCNHCVDFFRNTFQNLVREYVNSGQVNIAFYIYPLGSADYAVEYVSRCIPENRYLEYYQKIFDYQAQSGYWQRGADTSVIKETLYSIAQSEGLSTGQVDRCIDGAPQQGSWPVFTSGNRQNLTGVTALVINGEVFNDGNVVNNIWTLRLIIQRKLAGQ